jgi:hypothetical protein
MNTPLIAITPVDYFGQQKGDTKLYASTTEALAEVARLVSVPDTKVVLADTVFTDTGEWQASPLAFAEVSKESGWYDLTEVLP